MTLSIYGAVLWFFLNKQISTSTKQINQTSCCCCCCHGYGNLCIKKYRQNPYGCPLSVKTSLLQGPFSCFFLLLFFFFIKKIKKTMLLLVNKTKNIDSLYIYFYNIRREMLFSRVWRKSPTRNPQKSGRWGFNIQLNVKNQGLSLRRTADLLG
jgi:hypothetical protein